MVNTLELLLIRIAPSPVPDLELPAPTQPAQSDDVPGMFVVLE